MSPSSLSSLTVELMLLVGYLLCLSSPLNSKANKLEENLFSPRISLSVTEISFRCVEAFSSRVINKVFLPSLSLSL